MLHCSSRLLLRQQHKQQRIPKCGKGLQDLFVWQQAKLQFPQIKLLLQIQRREYHHSYHNFDYKKESNILVCGDGDLSYSASIAQKLARQGTHLTATVIESKEEHQNVFRDSFQNSDIIERCGHTVRFNTDATMLGTYSDLRIKKNKNCYSDDGSAGDTEKQTTPNNMNHDDTILYDRIQFNFPHWEGKTNSRKNRKLLSSFFASCTDVLHPQGQVHVALMDHQGGAYSQTIQDWKMSWMPALHAAESASLLLTDVIRPYTPTYNVGGHRWKDRAFHTKGKEAHLYIFTKSECSQYAAPQHLQLYCHYQLLVGGHPYVKNDNDNNNNATAANSTDINDSVSTPPLPPPPPKHEIDTLEQFMQDEVPSGWRVKLYFTKWVPGCPEKQLWTWLALYQVAFFGKERSITRSEAEKCRLQIEDKLVLMAETQTKESLHRIDIPPLISRSRWMISNVFPQSLRDAYNASEK